MSHSALARIVKIVNLAVAMVVVAALAVVYWCAWRPLPQRSGSIEAPVAAPVAVQFDALGVPHMRGASQEDALFAQGYVTAQDRLWQMDALRRLAAGDLAEIVGAGGARFRPRIAPPADAPHRRARLRRSAGGGPRRLGRLCPRRQCVHRHPPRQPAARIPPARLPAASVERGGFAADLPAHVSHAHHHLARRYAQARHAGPRRRAQESISCFPGEPPASRRRAPTPGPSPAPTRLPASRCSRTTCTWSTGCPASGT